MKILVVAHESEFIGGANRSLYAILKYWKDNTELQFEVLLPSANGSLIDELQAIGVKCHFVKYYKIFSEARKEPIDILRKIRVNYRFLYNKKAARIFSQKIKNAGFQLVYSNTRMTTMGACIAKELGIPHVIHIREFGNENTIWGLANIEWINDNASRIIVISQALKNYLVNSVSEEKFVVSYNGIQYSHDVNITSHKKTTTDILLTGRITASKAQDEAVHAAKILCNRGYKNFVIHFAGSVAEGSRYENEYLINLKKLISDLGIESKVHFHGEVKDMKALREQMDIELMCSLKETFGRVTVEAMRSGLLVIGGNTGATPEIIDDGTTGLIYRQGDPEDLAEKIIWVINNPEETLKIKINARIFANENFTVEENASEILEILTDVCNKENKF